MRLSVAPSGDCYIKHDGDDNAVYCFMENGTIYNNGNMGFIPGIIRQRVERGSLIRSKRGKEYGESNKGSFSEYDNHGSASTVAACIGIIQHTGIRRRTS